MSNLNPLNLVVVTGPTASGKTGFAAKLAQKIKGEIISADSRQVYKGMDLGTGKDYGDYQIGDIHIPYHLIDIMEPGTPYNVYSFQQDFIEVFGEIHNRGCMPILCGGTGLYIEAVLKGYRLIEVPPNEELRLSMQSKSDEQLCDELKSLQKLHNKSDTDNRKRLMRALEIAYFYKENPPEDIPYPDINYKIIGIKFDRSIERERITERLKQRLEIGMIDEVKTLIDKFGIDRMEYFGLEYKYLAWYVSGKISHEQMFERLNTAIHQFAKRQMTWFRKMQRNGFEIEWINGSLEMDEKILQAEEYLVRQGK